MGRLILTAEAASRESLHMNPGILLHPPSTEAGRVKAIKDSLEAWSRFVSIQRLLPVRREPSTIERGIVNHPSKLIRFFAI